jgi:hypothetical protein
MGKVKSGSGAKKIESQPKKTCQGQGQYSKPSHNRKKSRGQGK